MPALNAIASAMNPIRHARRAGRLLDPRNLDPRRGLRTLRDIGREATGPGGELIGAPNIFGAAQPRRPQSEGLSDAVNKVLLNQDDQAAGGPPLPGEAQAGPAPFNAAVEQPPAIQYGQPHRQRRQVGQAIPPAFGSEQSGFSGSFAPPRTQAPAQPYQFGAPGEAQAPGAALSEVLQLAGQGPGQPPSGGFFQAGKKGRRGQGAGAPPAWSGRFVR